jgi:hypothetical protein
MASSHPVQITTTLWADVHPFRSVTVTVYMPGIRLLIDAVVAPVFHKYVYPGLPPLTTAVAVPLLQAAGEALV